MASKLLGFKVKVLSWTAFSKLSLKLWSRVKRDFKPDLVVAVLRGGYPVGLVLANLFGVALEALRVEHYKALGVKGERPRLLQPLRARVEGLRILLVDDIVDSGETLKLALDHLTGKGASTVRVAALHVKPWAGFKPNYYVEETEVWIVYPWELGEFARALRDKTGKTEALKVLGRLGLRRRVAAEVLDFLYEG